MEKIKNIINDCRGMEYDEIINCLIESRGINDIDEFLTPSIDNLLPLDSLYRINEGKDIVINGIKNNSRFKVLFDTDTDGVMSGTVITRWLFNFTKKVEYRINDGKKHGIQTKDLDWYKDCDILIIVDSLDADNDRYKKIYDSGVKTIVLDHHDIKKEVDYDTYVTLVSSNRRYKNTQLSGAGVVWKFCSYLDTYMGTNYANDLIDLATCGIIADMSDMSENSMENRYICNQGLNNLTNIALKKIVGSYEFNSTAISFSIASLINACNRVNRNELAVRLFMSDDKKEVSKLVKELQDCKEEQNAEVDRILPDVIDLLDKQDVKVLYAFIETEYGIGGLIGNKLLDRYQKPILILKDTGRSYAGSCRAIGVDDFKKLCSETGLCKADGHESAFGIEINKKDFDMFISSINNKLNNVVFVNKKNIDLLLNLDDINSKLIENIKKLERVSGTGFNRITVEIDNVTDYEISSFKGGKHLVVNNPYVTFIQWNTSCDYSEMEDNSLLESPINFVGSLDSGFLARKFILKMIIDEYEVKA